MIGCFLHYRNLRLADAPRGEIVRTWSLPNRSEPGEALREPLRLERITRGESSSSGCLTGVGFLDVAFFELDVAFCFVDDTGDLFDPFFEALLWVNNEWPQWRLQKSPCVVMTGQRSPWLLPVLRMPWHRFLTVGLVTIVLESLAVHPHVIFRFKNLFD